MRLCRCTSARHTSTALNHKPKKEKKKTQQNRYYMRMRNACTKCAQPITNYYVEKENIIMQYTMKINITLFCSLGPATHARARALFHYIILVFTMYLCMTFCDDGRFDFAKHYYILCVFTIQYICWLAKCLILF